MKEGVVDVDGLKEGCPGGPVHRFLFGGCKGDSFLSCGKHKIEQAHESIFGCRGDMAKCAVDWCVVWKIGVRDVLSGMCV